MKLSEYQRSRSFFDLVKGHSDFKVKLFDFGLYTQVSDSGPHGPLVFRGKGNSFCVPSFPSLFPSLYDKSISKCGLLSEEFPV